MIGTLAIAYSISQFLRNTIGVIAPDLATELGLNAIQIGFLSSAFYFAFAATQIPLGIALDRFGPKRCIIAFAGITIIGCLAFAAAGSAVTLILARILIGIGSASFLMGALALYARRFSPQQFSSVTGIQLGIGTLGTLVATAPYSYAVGLIGWRMTFVGTALVALVLALLVAVLIDEGERPKTGSQAPETLGESLRGTLAAIRIPGVGRLFVIQLTCHSSFVLLLGLWGAPYLAHVYGYSLQERGDLLFFLALSQIVGMFVWGGTDKWLNSYKIPVLTGSILTVLGLVTLAIAGKLPPDLLVIWFIFYGFVTAYVPVMIAHGASLFPKHLVGRGLTVLNIGTMLGVFLSQFISGAVINAFPMQAGAYSLTAYRTVFALQALIVLIAAVFYVSAPDPRKTAFHAP